MNIKVKPTWGPWSVGSKSICVGSDKAAVRVCTLNCDEDMMPEEVRHANARLIAAAPEMLMMLVTAERALDEVAGSNQKAMVALYAVRACIANATGPEVCARCKGEGFDPDLGTDCNPEIKCGECDGTGEVQ